MCGRYTLTAPPEAVSLLFALEIPPEPFPPRYNIAPTQPIPVVHRDEAGRRRLTLMRWGLVPSWVKDPNGFSLLINARIETAAEKPAFRAAMKRRRCLVPATGFYEWQKMADGSKRPFLLSPSAAPLIAFAGVYETWTGPDGEEVDTAAILTRDASADIASIHHRMPVVVPQEAFSAWLDTTTYDVPEAIGILEPTGEGFFGASEITRHINNARNEGPGVQAPAESEGTGSAPASGKPVRPACDQDAACDADADAPAARQAAAQSRPRPARAPKRRSAPGGQLDLL